MNLLHILHIKRVWFISSELGSRTWSPDRHPGEFWSRGCQTILKRFDQCPTKPTDSFTHQWWRAPIYPPLGNRLLYPGHFVCAVLSRWICHTFPCSPFLSCLLWIREAHCISCFPGFSYKCLQIARSHINLVGSKSLKYFKDPSFFHTLRMLSLSIGAYI